MTIGFGSTMRVSLRIHGVWLRACDTLGPPFASGKHVTLGSTEPFSAASNKCSSPHRGTAWWSTGGQAAGWVALNACVRASLSALASLGHTQLRLTSQALLGGCSCRHGPPTQPKRSHHASSIRPVSSGHLAQPTHAQRLTTAQAVRQPRPGGGAKHEKKNLCVLAICVFLGVLVCPVPLVRIPVMCYSRWER